MLSEITPPETDFVTPLPSGGYLVVPTHLMKCISKYRQTAADQPESGGILIGCYRQAALPDGAYSPISIELVSCSEPSGSDWAHRFGFNRKGKHHIQKAVNAWKKSRQEQTYLGEWHTHPEANPTPSSVDLLNWRRNLRGKLAILIISGIETDWIAFWNGASAIQLPPLSPDDVLP